MTAKCKTKKDSDKQMTKKPMEIGVLAMLRKNTDPFKVIADFGLKTAQVQCWDMTLLNEKFAKETENRSKIPAYAWLLIGPVIPDGLFGTLMTVL